MRSYKITEYDSEYKAIWDSFVDNSMNGTFLFKRDYVEYHADRFVDASLMFHDDKGKLCALFVASKHNDVVKAHGGLTYGGFVLPYHGVNAEVMLIFFDMLQAHLKAIGIKTLIYKAVPHIYHKYPCEDDIYALFRCGASLSEVNVSSTIYLPNYLPFDENSRRGVKRGVAAGLISEKSDNYDEYWLLLSEVLQSRHNVAPVHSAKEIALLKSRFHDNIELYVVRNSEGQCVAGVVNYLINSVAHCQYIASSDYGLKNGALPFLFNNLINIYATKGYKYLDFGTCNERNGMYLNTGLVRQKNGLGGRAAAYCTYKLQL
jgi:hypothetical protein